MPDDQVTTTTTSATTAVPVAIVPVSAPSPAPAPPPLPTPIPISPPAPAPAQSVEQRIADLEARLARADLDAACARAGVPESWTDYLRPYLSGLSNAERTNALTGIVALLASSKPQPAPQPAPAVPPRIIAVAQGGPTAPPATPQPKTIREVFAQGLREIQQQRAPAPKE